MEITPPVCPARARCYFRSLNNKLKECLKKKKADCGTEELSIHDNLELERSERGTLGSGTERSGEDTRATRTTVIPLTV